MNIEYTRRLEKIEATLAEKLPAAVGTDWILGAFSTVPDVVRGLHLQPLVAPCRELLLRGGKRWRPLLMVLACELAGGGDRAYGLTPIVEFAHTASLIHDDIEDNADERRGSPAIHLLYGEDTAINSASWLYFYAQSIIDSFPSSDSMKLNLYQIVSRELRRLHLGQAMDIRWHRDPALVPTRSEYEAMVSLKTGTLSRMAGVLGMRAGGAEEGEAIDFGELAARIGVGFQILDDVRNLTTGNQGKKRGDDVVEGKKSLPVILHLEKRPNDLAFLSQSFDTARNEGISSPAVEQVIARLADSGSIAMAQRYGIQQIEGTCLTLRGRYASRSAVELVVGLFDSMLDGLS